MVKYSCYFTLLLVGREMSLSNRVQIYIEFSSIKRGILKL